MIAAIALTLIVIRLGMGPVSVPVVGDLLTDRVNSELTSAQLEIDDVILSLGSGEAPAGIRFSGARLTDDTGALLLGLPLVGARFNLADLALGRVRPTRITLLSPEASLVRQPDGTIAFGLGVADAAPVDVQTRSSTTTDTTEPDANETELSSAEMLAGLFAGLAGDAPLPPVLEEFREARIVDAKLAFRDDAGDGTLRSARADLVLSADTGGVTVQLDAGLDGDLADTTLQVTVDRRRGAGTTAIAAEIEGLSTSKLATSMPELSQLASVDTVITGQMTAELDAAKQVTALEGQVRAAAGKLVGLGDQIPGGFDEADLAFEFDPASDRIRIDAVRVTAEAADLDLSAIVDLGRGKDGRVATLDTQIDLSTLAVRLPGVLESPVTLTEGQIAGRVDLGAQRLALADGHVRLGDLLLRFGGMVEPHEEGTWRLALQSDADGLDVDGLLALWPIEAGRNARRWIAENIRAATITDVSAALRVVGNEPPSMAVDFRYEDLEASYLGDLPLIRGASGTGHLASNDFLLLMDRGQVDTPDGTLRLDGSTALIDDLWGDVTPADLDVRGTGPIAAVLDLIDRAPLSLVTKLGLPLSDVAGAASVDARLRFPLLQALLLEQINADVEADLTNVALSLPRGEDVVPITSDRMALAATTQQMQLGGAVVADGVAMEVRWTERYGAGQGGTTLEASTAVTPDLLSAKGVADSPLVDGRIPLNVSVVRSGNAPVAFEIDADLAPAGLVMPALAWEKAAGQPGTLTAAGTFGETVTISRLAGAAEGLSITGAASLGADGALERVRIRRLVLEDRADISATIRQGRNGGFVARVSGAALDLTQQVESSGDPSPTAPDFRVSLELDRLTLVDDQVLHGAVGSFSRRDRAIDVTLSGRLQGGPEIALAAKTGEDGRVAVSVTGDDAGRLLQAANLMRGAQGGALVLDANLPSDGGAITGTLAMDGIRVPGLGDIESAFESEGVDLPDSADRLTFDRVYIPFDYLDGQITLGPSFATGSSLALKIEGDVDTTGNTVDIEGVASPAYGITGIFDGVPIFGTLLSGGEGEGVFAMTFDIKGRLDDPAVNYYPLSLLAPGFLRRVFTGEAKPADQRFLDNINRERD